MSEHDFNLISDVISGDLSSDERSAALAHIASDPVLQAEYETQLATASLLRDLPAPTMTAEERSMLHASLRRQLRLDDAPTPVVAPAPSRWQRWWAPVAGLAAAAAVVVGVVIVLPDEGSDDSFDVASAELTVTTAASREALDSVAGGADSDGSFADGEATPPEPAAGATTTTIAAATEETDTTAAVAGDVLSADPPGVLPHLPDSSLDEIARSYTASPDTFGQGFDSLIKDSSAAVGPGTDTCLAEAVSAADNSVVVPVATTVVGGVDAVVFSVAPPDADPYFVALDLATCAELGSTRP